MINSLLSLSFPSWYILYVIGVATMSSTVWHPGKVEPSPHWHVLEFESDLNSCWCSNFQNQSKSPNLWMNSQTNSAQPSRRQSKNVIDALLTPALSCMWATFHCFWKLSWTPKPWGAMPAGSEGCSTIPVLLFATCSVSSHNTAVKRFTSISSMVPHHKNMKADALAAIEVTLRAVRDSSEVFPLLKLATAAVIIVWEMTKVIFLSDRCATTR